MNPTPPLFDPEDVSSSELLNSALAEALSPIALDPARAAPMRQRLLDRARASREADRSFIHVRIDEGEWRTLLKGVRVKSLSSGPSGKALLVELAPGASLPGHAHREHEECIVLRGELKLGPLTVREGDYHVAPAGSRHGRIHSDSGALIYLRGTPIGDGLAVARDLISAWLPGTGSQPLTVRAAEGQWHETAPGAQTKALWDASGTAARSFLLRLQPGAKIAAEAGTEDQECLMLEGDAWFGDTLLRPGEYRQAPRGSARRALSSDAGALLFMRGADKSLLREAP